jgi:poly(beta-D-mannuronate) lyase
MRVNAGFVAICVSMLAFSAHAEDAVPEDEACFAAPDPVVNIALPSRYRDDSKTRSDIDEKANAAVNAALKPVDAFVTDLARSSNRALRQATDAEPDAAARDADCVLDRIAGWAKADALSGLDSLGAKMAIPSRVGGIAFAYALSDPLATRDADRQAVIEGWLRARATQTMAFFETEAPPRAAKNNLRAWAGLAVTRIGLTLGDEDMVAWGAATAELVACSANADGSLPLEMERGALALHYHLHAVGPLVATAALLEPTGMDLFNACDRAIPRAVAFAVAALENPELAAVHAGEAQSFSKDGEPPEAFEVAWIAPYLLYQADDTVAALGATFDVLANSKLGGDQALVWAEQMAEKGAKTP